MTNYKGFFITGTDTDIGKTTISALLVKTLNAKYWKPIQAGYNENNQTDADIVQNLSDLCEYNIIKSTYILPEAISPHLAAKHAQQEIKLENLILPNLENNEYIIVEGAGGILVPINDKENMLDLIKKLNLPVIIVAKTSLGTINHSILTIQKLQDNDIKIAGIIFNGEKNIEVEESILLRTNIECLYNFPIITKNNLKIYIKTNTNFVLKTKLINLLSEYNNLTDKIVLSNIDKELIWHPFTQALTATDSIIIKYAKNACVYDINNNKYIDAISSWWVNLHGHSHPYIANAIAKQVYKLEQVIFANFSHEPSINLCKKIQKFLPTNLSKFFFSDNGSTSVEIAIKLSIQYWQNIGLNKKTKIIALNGAYHGDTFGAMSVGKSSNFYTHFENYLFHVDFLEIPYTWTDDINIDEKEEFCLNKIEFFLTEHASQIACFIAEPLVQGAAGMKMYRPSFLNKIAYLCQKFNIHIILDEVMTGFGRTGKMFAFEYCNFIPDFLCLSKALTGGFLPLSLTITTVNIYNAFLDKSFEKAFAHGHSFTANPIACAAALASLELFKIENTLLKIDLIYKHHLNFIEKNKNNSKIKNLRALGVILALDIICSDDGYLSSISSQFKQFSLNKGVILRPLGNTIYVLVPACILENELLYIYQVIEEFIFN